MEIHLTKPIYIAREVPSIDVLRWLYASSYDSKHKKTRRERVKGSGAWLLKKQEYQEWYSDTSSTQLLWCHGKPGAGKTFIAYVLTFGAKKKGQY